MSARARQLPVYDSAKFRLPVLSELAELVRYRFLVSNLVARDLKVRYKRSTIGFVWVMLNPLLTMIVMAVVFGQIFRFNLPYPPVYLLGGLLLWNLFSQGTNACMAAMQGNGQIIRKLHVPPTAFVTSAIGGAVINLLFALVPLFAIALALQIQPSVAWGYVLAPMLLATLFSFGIGLIVSGMIVFFHDTFEIYQVLLQVYYFFTPIFYPAPLLKQLPEPWRALALYNPMNIYITSLRDAIMFGQIDLDLLLPGILEALIAVAAGWIFFTRVEDKFAYHV